MDMSHLHTADDIAEERLKLMAFRERIGPGPVEPGSEVWRLRVTACGIESAVTFRAVELGLETHD
jgi:hypothetical protein